MTYIYHTIKTLVKLEKSYIKTTEDGNALQIGELEIFENVAFIMLISWLLRTFFFMYYVLYFE